MEAKTVTYRIAVEEQASRRRVSREIVSGAQPCIGIGHCANAVGNTVRLFVHHQEQPTVRQPMQSRTTRGEQLAAHVDSDSVVGPRRRATAHSRTFAFTFVTSNRQQKQVVVVVCKPLKQHLGIICDICTLLLHTCVRTLISHALTAAARVLYMRAAFRT